MCVHERQGTRCVQGQCRKQLQAAPLSGEGTVPPAVSASRPHTPAHARACLLTAE